ncbi:ATP-binding protein [Planomonospora corallina]
MAEGEWYGRLGDPLRPDRGLRGPGACVSPDTPYGTWRREFPGEEASVPAAREWARELLDGRVAAPVLDDVVLLLSEVVTNAVTHSDSGRTADGRVVVWMVRAPEAVHVEVADGGSAVSAPAVRVPAADEDSGRGLWLVDLLSAAWGSHRDAIGGSVWFRVAER